jgi:hypothetical protein
MDWDLSNSIKMACQEVHSQFVRFRIHSGFRFQVSEKARRKIEEFKDSGIKKPIP